MLKGYDFPTNRFKYLFDIINENCFFVIITFTNGNLYNYTYQIYNNYKLNITVPSLRQQKIST